MKTLQDITDLRWQLATRVSTPGQEQGPSLDSQDTQLEELVERAEGEIVGHIRTSESATTLDRETVDEIVKKAKEDEFDVLGIAMLDRLTRADPWEAIDLIRTLYENDIIICAADYGPYDWEDLQDFRKLANDIAFSREIVVKIKEGQERGFRTRLEDRKWPFSKEPPAGFKLDDDQKLYLKDGAESVIPDIFETYLELASIAGTCREINDEILPEGEIDELSEAQVASMLNNRMFLGELGYDGDVYATFDEFALVSEETFQEVAELRRQNSPTSDADESSSEELDSIDHLEAFAKRFGAHYTFLNILTRFVPLCSECGGKMDWDGSQTGQALGLTVPRFECEDCESERNIPDTDELRAMHQVLPYRCPYCVSIEEFTVRPINRAGTKFDYEHTCEICGHAWGSEMSADQLRRFLDHPNLGFSINDECPGRYEPPDDDSQQELGEFEEETDDE